MNICIEDIIGIKFRTSSLFFTDFQLSIQMFVITYNKNNKNNNIIGQLLAPFVIVNIIEY